MLASNLDNDLHRQQPITHPSTHLSAYLPVYQSTYLPVYQSSYLPVWLAICQLDLSDLSTFLPTYKPTYLSTCQPINCLHTYLSICPPVYLPSQQLPTYLPVYPPSCLPDYLSTCLPTLGSWEEPWSSARSSCPREVCSWAVDIGEVLICSSVTPTVEEDQALLVGKVSYLRRITL